MTHKKRENNILATFVWVILAKMRKKLFINCCLSYIICYDKETMLTFNLEFGDALKILPLDIILKDKELLSLQKVINSSQIIIYFY